MNIELTPDETSLLTGILIVWKTQINNSNYEKMLIDSIIEKIFAEDKIAIDKVLGKTPPLPASPENSSKIFFQTDIEE